MRPIDAEKFDTIAYSHAEMQARGYEDSFDDGVRYLAEQIDAAPTLDVAPVVHGYNTKEDSPSLFGCSVCGWFCWDTYCGDTDTYNYCPNCGAKMRGERR